MLEHGQIPQYVPNWWNPYSHNVGQEDPRKKLKLVVILKLVLVVVTILGGAILALCLNVFMPPVQRSTTFSDNDTCLQKKHLNTSLNQRMSQNFDPTTPKSTPKGKTNVRTTIQYRSTKKKVTGVPNPRIHVHNL